MEGRFYYSIASGSTGNCSLYMCDDTAILIDLGVSVRRLQQALRAINLEITDLTAILFTHAHTDHTKGIATFVKKYAVPLYATHGTAAEIIEKTPQAAQKIKSFWGGEIMQLGAVSVQSFLTPHDAAESVGYILKTEAASFGFVTDLGFMPAAVSRKLAGCDTVVLESNHDLQMLANGPYPWQLQERIRSPRGHLSNADCAVAAAALARQGTQQLILAHLSEKNNTPYMALRETQRILDAEGIFSCQVTVAPKDAMQQPLALPIGTEARVCCL